MRAVMIVLNECTHDSRVRREAAALAEAGHEVAVVALGREGLAESETIGGAALLRLRLTARPWRGRVAAPAVKLAEFTARVRALAPRLRPDVVHAHDANTLGAGRLLAARVRAALVYDAHEYERDRNWATRRVSRLYRGLTDLPERAFIRRADAVITTSDGFADALARDHRIARPVVVRNCADFPLATRTDRLRRALGIPPDLAIAVHSGGLLGARGVETLALAAAEEPRIAAVFVGDGPLAAWLREGAAAGRLPRVYHKPAVPPDDLAAWLASADVGVTLTEPVCEGYRLALPNKLFEYLQAGLPVVASDLPELARIVRGEGVGEVVDPRSPAEVAAAIRRLAFDGPARARALAAVAVAAPRHHWREEKRKLLAVYERLARRERRDTTLGAPLGQGRTCWTRSRRGQR